MNKFADALEIPAVAKRRSKLVKPIRVILVKPILFFMILLLPACGGTTVTLGTEVQSSEEDP